MMYTIVKRIFDIVCSLVGFIGTLPFWLIAIVGIELSDPGPVFYFARRVSKHNEEFKMVKFRSMRQGKANEAVFRGDEDRIFPFGHFIRKTKIDELPQLINIFIGNMSIVGPRPASIDQLEITRGGKYSVVNKVQSGLTGPSALYDFIYGDGIKDANEYEQMVLPTRLELDAWYVENMGTGLDLKMIWWTIVCVLAEVFHRKTPKIYKWLVERVASCS